MRWLFPSASLAGFILSGCATSPLLGPVMQTTANAQKAQSAQSDFLNSVRSTECRIDRLKTLAESGPSGVDLNTPCSHRIINDANFAVRQELMTTVVVYTQALSKLQGVNTTTLDMALKNAATQFGTDAKAGGFLTNLSAKSAATSDVLGAVQSMMDWIVQDYRDRKVQEIATLNKDSLNIVLKELEVENQNEANAVSGIVIEAYEPVTQLTKDPRRATIVANVLTIDQAFWGSAATSTPMMMTNLPTATQVNDTLDQLKACHDLIAAGGEGTAAAKAACKLDFSPLKAP
jgi:hypothetical protein